MSANEHIDELLSGFLDGELSAEELRQFELAMSTDGTLAIKLEQFRQIGADLRSVPKRTLGPDFANRVLAAARQESAVSDSSASPSPAIEQPRRYGWRATGVAVALAASLLFAVYVSNWLPTPSEDLAQVPSGGSASEAIGSEAIGSEATGAVQPNTNKESTVRNDSGMRKRITSQSFAILTILEIEPSLKAWNENEFSKVLSDVGITWTKPVNVSDELIGALNDTRSISRGLPKTDAEQLALVMVTANGMRMDKAMIRLFSDEKSFPYVRMDMAFDLPGKELFEKLVDANGQQAIATPIVAENFGSGNVSNSGLEAVSQFSAARPAEYPASRQRQQFGTAITGEEEDSLSHVLIIVRKPAK